MNNSKENLFLHANAELCMACSNCVLACSVAHSGHNLLDAIKLELKIEPRNELVQVAEVVMPMQCRHCEDAPCAIACPTGAISHHEAGFVNIEESNCIACKVCNMVCPFGAIKMANESQEEGTSRTKRTIASKCDLCHDQISADGEFNCACIEACPTQAIQLIDYETYRKQLVLRRTQELVNAQTSMKTCI
ncbi:MAG: carbon-monoxide dehydrogenase iron sulfur subunit [Sulfurimonas sp.]|jgi:carbon-monoxide dehydrogenase iron sulfur subunit